jgi:hypothetical protein
VLAYVATKTQFLIDAPTIEDKVEAAVLAKLGIRVGPNEKTAWRNSLGNAMSHIVRDARIPNDSGVAIEYRLNGRRFRIDFMLSGTNAAGKESLVIIELKQWSHVDESSLTDHVAVSFGGHSPKDTLHPSAQVYRYETFLRDMSEVFASGEVNLSSLAFLHNLDRVSVGAAPLYEKRFTELVGHAPIYAKDQIEELSQRLEDTVGAGGGEDIVGRITASKFRPSKKLLDHVSGVIANEPAFTLLDEQVTAFTAVYDETTRSDSGLKKRNSSRDDFLFSI